MKLRTLVTLLSCAGLSSALATVGGCGGTSIGNPYTPTTDDGNGSVTLQFNAYTSFNLWDWLLPRSAYASVTQVTFCFNALYFDADPNSPSTLSVFLPLDEVVVSSGGINMGDTEVPIGTYRRIEFGLNSHCSAGKSLIVTNDNGTFSTTDVFGINFSGTTVISSGSQILPLGIQPFIDQLNTITADTQIKAAMQATSGTF